MTGRRGFGRPKRVRSVVGLRR